MVMPRSSTTIWLHVVLSTVACFCHTSAAPKNPKPSMLWYFVARSMVTSADAIGAIKQRTRPVATPKWYGFFMGLPFAIEFTKAQRHGEPRQERGSFGETWPVYSGAPIRGQRLQLGGSSPLLLPWQRLAPSCTDRRRASHARRNPLTGWISRTRENQDVTKEESMFFLCP